MTPFERAAKALGEVYDGCADPVSSPNNWARAQEGVRAVLLAVREPTPEMIEAMANTSGMKAVSTQVSIQAARGYPLDPNAMTNGSPLEQAWRAGIDAALSE